MQSALSLVALQKKGWRRALTMSNNSSTGDCEKSTSGNEMTLSNRAADHCTGMTSRKAELPDSKKRGKHRKKRGLLQLFTCLGRGAQSSEMETVATPPTTVAQIREHINDNRLLSASKDLLALERKIYSKTYVQSESEVKEEQTELENLYQHLERSIFKIIEESFINYNPELLKQAVDAITEQENENENHLSEKVPPMRNSASPREWKSMWLDVVRHSVEERMTKKGEQPSNNVSVIAELLLHLGKTFRDDLTHVVTHLEPCYTKDYDVCNTYAKFYLEIFRGHLRTFTEFELDDKDTYLILSWVESFYPNDILNHFSSVKDLDVDKLRDLLPIQIIRELEYNYIVNEEELVREWMHKSLAEEVKRWKEEKEPKKWDNCFHSELPIDILQMIEGAKQKAAKLSDSLSWLVMERMMLVLSDLLKSYKESFEAYKEEQKEHKYFQSVIIMNINSCQTFRENIKTHLNLMHHVHLSALSSIENAGFEVLLQDLFQDLKLFFRQFSQKNGLCSFKTMQDIIKTTTSYLSQLTMLKETCYQDAVEKIHFHLVKEYIVRLMKKKVSQKNPDEQQSMANQILKNSQLIEDCCYSHGSKATWLNPVIPTLAEIIKLQDTSAIQIEVASLARKYPDIKKKHVASILYIKGNLTNAEVRAIQDILDVCEKPTDSRQPFFSHV